jgi:pimeloyl-ACP methyl ester carboxylesterase
VAGEIQTRALPSGITLAYRDEGAGEPLVLIHAITEDHRAWDVFAPELARSARVIRVDLPGHGASSPLPEYNATTLVTPLAELVSELGLERPRLVGHSLGGFLATLLGGLVPARSIVNLDQPLRLGAFIELVRKIAPHLQGGGEVRWLSESPPRSALRTRYPQTRTPVRIEGG